MPWERKPLPMVCPDHGRRTIDGYGIRHGRAFCREIVGYEGRVPLLCSRICEGPHEVEIEFDIGGFPRAKVICPEDGIGCAPAAYCDLCGWGVKDDEGNVKRERCESCPPLENCNVREWAEATGAADMLAGKATVTVVPTWAYSDFDEGPVLEIEENKELGLSDQPASVAPLRAAPDEADQQDPGGSAA